MCKHQDYNEFNQEICVLNGKFCYDEDCPAEEPSEHDVINGYFDDDPDGLRHWVWENYGCPKCKSKDFKKESTCYYTFYKCNSCNHEEEVD